jgi:hypothetical protein
MSELTNFVIESIMDDSESLNEYSGGNSIPNDGNATTGKQWNANWEEYDSEDYYLNGLPDWQFVDKTPSKREKRTSRDQKLPVDNQNDGLTTKYNRIMKQNFPMPSMNEMIRHEGDNWVVYDRKGKKKLGTHDTKKSALKQLRAIEINKHLHEIENELAELSLVKEIISEADATEDNPKIHSLETKRISLEKQKMDLTDRVNKLSKEINKINVGIQDIRKKDMEKNKMDEESVLNEVVTKNSIEDYYKTIMRELKIKPLKVKFQYVKGADATTQYELDTFKPIAILIDNKRVANLEAAIIHEITHHIKLVKEKNAYLGKLDKKPNFTRLEKRLLNKFSDSKYSNILWNRVADTPVSDRDETPVDDTPQVTPTKEPDDYTVANKTSTSKNIVKKQKTSKSDEEDKDEKKSDDVVVKPISKPNYSIDTPKKKRKTQDLNRKIKNPDTGKLIKLKSALRYPKDTKVHKAAELALARQK